MKKLTIFLLIFALVLCGCGANTSSTVTAESPAEDAPLTFGNAVITDAPQTVEALENIESSAGETIVGYIWRLTDYSISYDASTLMHLQSDWNGGFWVMNNAETADGLSFTALHCDENGTVLTETHIPQTFSNDNGGCDIVSYGTDTVFYDYTVFITRGGGDTPAQTGRYVRACDLDGNERFSVLLTDLTDEENPYISSIVATEEGCLVSTAQRIIALNKNGSVLYTIESEDFIEAMIRNSDGKVYIKSAFDHNAIYPIDTDTHTIGDAVYELSGAEYPQPGVLGYDLLLCDNSTNSPKVYGLNLDSGETTALWDCGAMGMLHAGNIVETGAGTLLLDYVSLMSGWGFGQLVQEPIYEGQEVTTLTLGTVRSLSVTADSAVAMFNSLYPEYYLQVATYSDAEAMNLAIISDEGPDIICLDGLSEEEYARNGQLLNLYDYLSTDETVSKEALVPEYLAEYETNGGLYRLSPVFNYGYMGINAEKIPEDIGSFAEYLSAAKGNQDSPVWEMTAESTIRVMLGYSMTGFIDFDAGTCNFDSEEFISLLELCSMGRMLTEDEYMDADWMYSPANVGIWDHAPVMGGLPVHGVLVTESMDTFGIYAGTEHPEMVWNFFSLLLSEDIQRSYAEMTGSCPILSSVYEELVPEDVQGLISEANGHWVSTSPVYEVVNDEATNFFAGEITAEAAASNINSRIRIYLSEQMG